MKRVALVIQYDGSYYSGWQRQKNAISVQETLENALFKISNQNNNISSSTARKKNKRVCSFFTKRILNELAEALE